MHVCSLVIISFVQFFMTWGCAEGLAIVSPTWLVTIVLSAITDNIMMHIIHKWININYTLGAVCCKVIYKKQEQKLEKWKNQNKKNGYGFWAFLQILKCINDLPINGIGCHKSWLFHSLPPPLIVVLYCFSDFCWHHRLSNYNDIRLFCSSIFWKKRRFFVKKNLLFRQIQMHVL